MEKFQPDCLFLKRSGNGYVDKVLQYNDRSVVDGHIAAGYITLSSVEDNISRLGVQRLREVLREKGLPASGNKAAMVSRVMAGMTKEEIEKLPLEPRLMLTDLGKSAIEEWEAAEAERRVARASVIADLIEAKKYQKAADLIRPAGSISASSDYLPEAIGRFMEDRGVPDRGALLALVEDVIMGHYPRTVIPDMESLGYNVSEDALNAASAGCHAYANAVQADRLGRKYRIHACKCCQSKDGKTFPLSKAKIGRTLPPFSKGCIAWVSVE